MSTRVRSTLLAVAAAALLSCRAEPQVAPSFPQADRSAAPIVSDAYSTEEARDRVREFEQVIEKAGIRPGMSVADVGAGEGYYTVRLARIVGPRGQVVGQDIFPDVRARLQQRVQRERLANVSVQLGTPEDPGLAPGTFDRILLVHMYHEVAEPYEFLWNLRDSLKDGGEIVVVDANRPIQRHGIQPDLLKCELAAIGLTLSRFAPIEGGDSYVAAFRAVGSRPEPGMIRPCAMKG